ncbi:GntR family transcriptional regulator [Sporosarcina sp. CAU 1771]
MINRNEINPMYQQIASYLTQKINNGSYSEGDKIPTEVELIEQFKVSRTTVRLGVKQLIENGLVEKKAGKGTFVTKAKHYHPLNEFNSLYAILSEKKKDVEVDLIDYKIVNVNKKICDLFNIDKEKEVLEVTRLYHVNKEPVTYAKMYIHPDYSNYISQDDAKTQPLYQILENRLSLKVSLVDLEIFASKPTDEAAKLLKLNKKDSVLNMERILTCDKNNPIEYTLACFPSDAYRFKITLPKEEANFTKNLSFTKKEST